PEILAPGSAVNPGCFKYIIRNIGKCSHKIYHIKWCKLPADNCDNCKQCCFRITKEVNISTAEPSGYSTYNTTVCSQSVGKQEANSYRGHQQRNKPDNFKYSKFFPSEIQKCCQGKS